MSYLQRCHNSVGSFEEDGQAVNDEVTLTPHEAYEVERVRTSVEQRQHQLEDYNMSESNVSSHQNISTLTQKKRLITAIFSIALVTIAVSVGASIASKSSTSSVVVIRDNVSPISPSKSENTTVQEAVEPDPDLISTEIVEDGIIYDFVAQQEVHVEEPQFDLEVVEFKGDISDFIYADVARFSIDANDESCNSEGALWEYESITDLFPWETSWKLFREEELWVHGPPSKTSYNRLTNYRGTLCLPAGNYEMVLMDSEGDGSCCEYGFGGYTVKVGGVVVASSNMKENDPFEKRTYTFSIEQPTTSTSTAATTTAAATTTTTTSVTTTTVAVEESKTEPSVKDSTQDPTSSPSSGPTITPSQAPSLSPSLKPTPLPTFLATDKPTLVTPDISECRGTNVVVGIEILTDGNGAQTSYTLAQANGVEIVSERKTNTMSSNEKYLDEVCVSSGTYDLILEDTKGNGIRDPGYIAVYLDGEKILHDYRFNKNKKTYTIQVGFDPPMTDTDTVWLNGHNKRRKDFHEANGKVFRPLTWSPEVAQSATNWAEKIVADGCVLSREKNLDLGELTFAMITSNQRAARAEPESVLKRWYDKHIDDSLPSLVDDNAIPGLAFSQVVWLASRYVGCTKQVGQLPQNRYCHVVLCRYVLFHSVYEPFPSWRSPLNKILHFSASCDRYATAGNCNVRMRSNEWKTRTLADKSICGPVCPEGEGCH